MSRTMRGLATSLIALFSAVASGGEPVAGVSVVRVDAIVTDRHGRHVADLRPEDFVVREAGQVQLLKQCVYVAGGPGAEAPAAQPAAGGTAEAPAGSGAALRADARERRMIAFLVDDLHLSVATMARVRERLLRFLDKEMAVDDLVGVFTTGGLQGMRGLTSDREMVRATVSALRWNALSWRFRPLEEIEVGLVQNSTITPGRMPGYGVEQSHAELLAANALSALRFLVKGLSPLPGRKGLVLLSDGLAIHQFAKSSKRTDKATGQLQDGLWAVADDANRGSVVISAIDTRSIQPLVMAADDVVSVPGFTALTPMELRIRRDEFANAQEGLRGLAEATGGLFEHDTDLGRGVTRLIEDQSGYYLLGYETEAPASGPGKFHRVEVQVARPGLTVRARSGYWSGQPPP